jgi:phage-related protein
MSESYITTSLAEASYLETSGVKLEARSINGKTCVWKFKCDKKLPELLENLKKPNSFQNRWLKVYRDNLSFIKNQKK